MIHSTARDRRVLLDARGPVVSGSPTLFNRFRRLVNEKHPIAGPQAGFARPSTGAEPRRRILEDSSTMESRSPRKRHHPREGDCPFGNPRGWAKPPNVQPVDGFLTGRGRHLARGLSTGERQTCRSGAATRSGARVRRWFPLSGVSSGSPMMMSTSQGGRKPAGGRVPSRVKIPDWGWAGHVKGCSWAVRSLSFARGGQDPPGPLAIADRSRIVGVLSV